MSTIDTQSLLSEMRRMAAGAGAGAAPTGAEAPPAADFAAVLREMLHGVNATQQASADLGRRFELGEPGVDLAQVMIAGQQSKLAFQATLQVRNKLVQAYQDIMNMPV